MSEALERLRCRVPTVTPNVHDHEKIKRERQLGKGPIAPIVGWWIERL